jgi:fimbrial chaperone protein
MLCVLLVELSALEIMPFIHSFDPETKESAFQYYVTNKGNSLLAFEISVFIRTQENGVDILTKDDDSFAVFPSQIIIPPHTKRTVKVRWLGNENYKRNKNMEQAFRVCFDQFPINMTPKKQPREQSRGASIVISLKIMSSLYMTPEGAAEKLELVSISKDGSVMTVRNVGTKRASINKMTIKIKGIYLKDLLGKGGRDTVILAGATREFKIAAIPWKREPEDSAKRKDSATREM